ncbi:Integral membrane protein SED5 [Emydomyces testavorans]|uniref:Integral membrane protein SED5 n=1 Tax=Emydomyces testavorans TaxID=2070801 RepID=A0AAF0DKB9_9EURO|nr:Integral membrane protein SED5 [Emydomyces testavorans]
MGAVLIQDRTSEFRSVLGQAQKRLASSKVAANRQALLRQETPPPNAAPKKSEFARRAAEIGRGITTTTAKLQRLAQLAKRKSLFDDRPVEISELTYMIKQDLASLNSQIAALQSLTLSQHPKASRSNTDQEGQHNDNVVVMLQGKLADVGANFKDVLEVRTRNIQASQLRTENFVSSVSSKSQTALSPQRSDSPLYNPPRSRSPQPGSHDLLTLEPPRAMHSDQQLLMMEEAQPANTYIQARGEAIEAIERTISELGGIFGQLATMVSEQSEMIQRIDANTEDVVDNVQGAHRELLKYWSRVSGNRWLIAKMFGVLMPLDLEATLGWEMNFENAQSRKGIEAIDPWASSHTSLTCGASESAVKCAFAAGPEPS